MAIMIGIRELRQHASKYLRRVRAGETITLTDRGEPFAEIRPVSSSETLFKQLVAAGRIEPAEADDLAAFLSEHPPLPVESGAPTSAEILAEMREDRL